MKHTALFLKKIYQILFFFILSINLAYADLISGSHRGLGGVSYAASSVLNNIAKLILYVAIIGGIAFILTALLKLKQHWRNPQQVPISHVISLFILGIFLIGIPLLVNYTQSYTTFQTGFLYHDYNNIKEQLNA